MVVTSVRGWGTTLAAATALATGIVPLAARADSCPPKCEQKPAPARPAPTIAQPARPSVAPGPGGGFRPSTAPQAGPGGFRPGGSGAPAGGYPPGRGGPAAGQAGYSPGRGGPAAGRPGSGRRPVYSTSRSFTFHGRSFAAVRARPYRYINGYGYRRFYAGQIFPSFLLLTPYFLTDYYLYNLSPPSDPSLVWVRFGPDALLVNTYTGQVVDTAPGVFDEDPGYDDGGYGQDPGYAPPPPPGYGQPPDGGYPDPGGYPPPPPGPQR